MATSIADTIAIKLGIDATGVATGMKHATAEALRASREIDKAESVEREHNLRQQMEATEEASRAKIKSEEAFKKWYAQSLEDEFQLWYASELRKEKEAESFAADQRAQIGTLAAMRAADADRRTKERADTTAMIVKYAAQEAAAERSAMDMLATARTEDADRRIKERTETAATVAALAAQEAAAQRAASDIIAADRAADADRRVKDRIETTATVAKLAAQEAAAERAQADIVSAERIADADTRIKYRRESAAMIARLAAEEAAAEQLALRETQRVAEQVRSDMRQAAINQANALSSASVQTQFMPAETMDRRLELDKLQEDLEKRYAIIYAAQDKEERLRRNARLVENRNEQEARQRGLGLMREAQAARERSVAESARREQAILDKKAADTLAKSKLEHDNRVLERNNADIAAAARVLNSLMTVQERYAVELARLTRLSEAHNMATGRALLTDKQLAQAKTALTIATIRQQQAMNGAALASVRAGNMFGGMAGAMTQASYAAEDFIQVFSMGGGLNMALMSASNNLSMVVRALAGTSGALASIAGFAVPAVLLGVGALVRGLMEEEEQAKKTADALRDTADAVDRLFDAHDRQYKHPNAIDEIRRIETMEGIMNRINEQEKKRNDLLQEQERLEARLAALRSKAGHKAGDYVPLEMLLAEIQQAYDTAIAYGDMSADPEMLRQQIEGMTDAYNELQSAIASGNDGDIIVAARAYNDELEKHLALFGMLGGAATKHAQEKIAALLAEEDALKAIKDAYGEQAAGQEEINNILKQIEDAEKRRIEIADTIARQQADALKAAQEEYLLKLKMTDAEREAYDLRKAQEDFMGPAAHGLMGMGGGPMDILMQQALEQQNEAARIAFLEAQRAALVKDLEALVPEIIVKAGLEQSAMDAQAKAFDQMLQASAKKPDPQLERIGRHLESIDTAIKNGGRIEVIQ